MSCAQEPLSERSGEWADGRERSGLDRSSLSLGSMGDRYWQGRFARGLRLQVEGGGRLGGAQSPDKMSTSGLALVEEVYEYTVIESSYGLWCSGDCLRQTCASSRCEHENAAVAR